MSWNDLAQMGLTVRPFDGSRPPLGDAYSRFDTPFRKTLRLLTRELEMLGARKIVVELDVREQDIRLDGYPRANAKAASSAVAVSFESKHGPLRYATGEYADWQDNLRAIALSLEALRTVDRYGVSKRGEQYRGWRALEAGSGDPADLIQTVAQAKEFLAGNYDGDLRRALMETHPDKGGDAGEFRKVVRCKELIEA